MPAVTINPSTGKRLNSYEFENIDSVNNKLQSSYQAFQIWKQIKFVERAEYILKLKDLLLADANDLAKNVNLEMGKPLLQAVAEIKKCTTVCDYYAKISESTLKSKTVKTSYKKSMIVHSPLGVILGIMPWNFPYWQVIRFVVPTLMAGNTVVLKHAPNVFGCMKDLEQLFVKAGFPVGVISVIYSDVDVVPEVIESHYISGVSLTGSEAAGKSVYEHCGKNLKKCVLELGGNDAYLVLKDADLDLAISCCLKSRLLNTGQSCVAAKRWIVDEVIYNEFLEKLIAELKIWELEIAIQEERLGPIARKDLQIKLHQQVEKTVSQGANLILGGNLPEGESCYYPVTLLEDVKPGMESFEEELFGPVISLIKAKDTDDAVRLANQSKYGLGGAIFSNNESEALEIAKNNFDTGGVFINDFLKSQAELPFGGTKCSGLGRELSEMSLFEFSNQKTIVLA